jgi:hypothetical protein
MQAAASRAAVILLLCKSKGRYALKGIAVRRLLFVVLCVGLVAVCISPVYAGQPTVTIAYSPSIDSVCSLFRGGVIKDEWKTELSARKPDFESLWAAVGPKMIEAAEAVTGKPFPPENITARLTLCDLPSQSIVGVSVNMRYALKSFTSTPVPIRYKVDTLFHELLHIFLAKHPIDNSSLMKQNASEPDRTRDHLHLLALQKAVLLRLNQADALKDVIAIDSQLPSGYYKRAWEIVNATDTEYLRYVAEISR